MVSLNRDTLLLLSSGLSPGAAPRVGEKRENRHNTGPRALARRGPLKTYCLHWCDGRHPLRMQRTTGTIPVAVGMLLLWACAQRAPSPRIGRALQEVRMQRRAGRRGCRAAGRRSPATITDRRSASRTCRPVAYIGGTRPFLPANTRSAVNAPSEFRLATTKTCTPGCRSPDSPGSMATMGMPAGMAIVCEPPEAPSLYRSINDDPACLDTVPFVIFDVVTMPFVILEATAVPLVILLPRETPANPSRKNPHLPRASLREDVDFHGSLRAIRVCDRGDPEKSPVCNVRSIGLDDPGDGC